MLHHHLDTKCVNYNTDHFCYKFSRCCNMSKKLLVSYISNMLLYKSPAKLLLIQEIKTRKIATNVKNKKLNWFAENLNLCQGKKVKSMLLNGIRSKLFLTEAKIFDFEH